jgi:PAS domain S-box-containing protein
MAPTKTIDANCGDCLLFGAVQGMTDGLVLLDESGRILHLNRTAAGLLRLQASGVIGAEIADAIPNPGLATFWNSAAGEAGTVSGEVPFPSGTTIRATISPCLSASGEAMGRVLILRDVTREKKIQVELASCAT